MNNDTQIKTNEAPQTQEERQRRRIRSFYVALVVSSLMLLILYVGMLFWPPHYIDKANCAEGGFLSIAFTLNPLAYIMLLTTGIVGVMTKKTVPTLVGVLLIISAPIAWFFTSFWLLGFALCSL